MIYYYDIKYRIFKNNDYFLLEKKHIDFIELVDFIVFENNKHGRNFQIYSIKPYYYRNF